MALEAPQEGGWGCLNSEAEPASPCDLRSPGGPGTRAGVGGGGGTDMDDNLLIDLPGVSCLQPLREGGPVPRRVPWLLTYEEVRDDGPVKQGHSLLFISERLGFADIYEEACYIGDSDSQWAPRRPSVIASERPAGTRPDHRGFHNRRCTAPASLLGAQPI